MNNYIHVENTHAFHPGYYLDELIQEMNMTQAEFAVRLRITPKNLSDVLNGKASISDKIAKNLSLMLGTSVEVWLDLQKKYDQKVIEIKTLKAQQQEVADLSLIDYSYFVQLGVVQDVRDKTERVAQLLKFFAISSFQVFKKPDFLVKFRQAKEADEKTIFNANAWVQTVMNAGSQMETHPFSAKKLRAALPRIREMTLHSPADCVPELTRILSECGIALVLLPSLKNSGVYGATKWADKEKVIVGMSSRRKYADMFWFSLFHELGHVLQKKTSKILVDFAESGLSSESEEEADRFAKEKLIPEKAYQAFLAGDPIEETTINAFARSIGTHPGMIVGRLQKEGHLSYSLYNELKLPYSLSSGK